MRKSQTELQNVTDLADISVKKMWLNVEKLVDFKGGKSISRCKLFNILQLWPQMVKGIIRLRTINKLDQVACWTQRN